MIKVLEKDYLKDDFINKPFVNDLSLKEKITFTKNNIYYFGNYDDDKLELIKKKLLKNRKSLINAIEKGIKFIVCGNSYELFNNHFKHDGLNIFTVYNSKMFKHSLRKMKVKNESYDTSIKIVKDLSQVIDATNFKYKNLLCIKDSKLIDKIIKKTK